MKKFGISGSDLKAMRKRRKLTQDTVAKRIGVKRQTLGNWENDIGSPPSLVMFKLLSLFGLLSLSLLFDEVQQLTEQEEQNTD